MTKKRRLILFVCILVLVAISAAVFLPWQWTVAEATDSEGWKLTVHKIPWHKMSYVIQCIVDFSLSPDLMDYRYKCSLSKSGRIVSTKTFAWPSLYPQNIQIEFMDELSETKGTAVIQFHESVKVQCSWSHDYTVWEEIDIN